MTSGDTKLLRRRLTEMARNLWWTWNPDVVHIFRDIDPSRWREANHNPIVFLNEFSDEELVAQVEGKAILSRINYQFWRLREYLQLNQLDVPLIHQVEQSTRRSNKNVCSSIQPAHLVRLAHATVDQSSSQPQALPVCRKAFL